MCELIYILTACSAVFAVCVCLCVCYLSLLAGNCHCLRLIGLGGHQRLMQPAAIKSSI